MTFPLRGWFARKTAIWRIIAAGVFLGVVDCEHPFDGATKGAEESSDEPAARVSVGVSGATGLPPSALMIPSAPEQPVDVPLPDLAP